MNRKAGTPPETKRIVQSRGFFRRPGILRLNVRRDAQGDEGAAMVEMALVCSLLLFMIFGIIEVSIGLYTYHYISDAAREGSRWAMVRGYNSCTNTPNLWKSTPGYTCPNGATQADISSYVKSLGYWSNDTNMTVTATWLSPPCPSCTTPTTTWTPCGTTGACKQPGFMVGVTVEEDFPLSIPYWQATTRKMYSTSKMVISQ